MKSILIKIAGLILMVVSFIAFVTKAPAFPIASENLLPWSVWFTISVLVNMVVWFPVMKLVSFSLGVIWFYAFVAGLVPEGAKAIGTITELDPNDPDAAVEIGAIIFNTKGQCSGCHTLDTSAPKGRCPDLTNIGADAGDRQPGVDAKSYLIDSLYEPGKYLVPGYGKIMPEVWKKPIELTKLEIAAVIAFLQSQGGEVDLEPFKEPIDRKDIGTTEAALPPLLPGDPEKGKEVFISAACISCHVVQGLENPKAGEVSEDFEVVTAPELTEIAAMQSMRYIEESILKPNAEILPGYGSVTVQTKDGTYSGTLVSEDDEKIVVRTKADDGTEQEHTILLSELEEVSIEELTELKARGFFTLTVTLSDTNTSVSGKIIEETDETVTLKVGENTETISKASIQKQFRGTNLDGEEIIAEYISGDLNDVVVINIDGNEETIDPLFDFEQDAMLLYGTGKKLYVTSPMPTSFPDDLSVSDMANLRAFLSTLTGETETAEAAADTNGASTTEIDEATVE